MEFLFEFQIGDPRARFIVPTPILTCGLVAAATPLIKFKQDSLGSKSSTYYDILVSQFARQVLPARPVSGLVASSPGSTNGSVATLLLAASCQTLRPQTDQPSTRLRNKTHPRVCLCGVNMFVCLFVFGNSLSTTSLLNVWHLSSSYYQPCYSACYNNNVSDFLSLMPNFLFQY